MASSMRMYNAQKSKERGEVIYEDLDKLGRSIVDAMTKRREIVRTATRKHYWVHPGIAVNLGLIEPEDSRTLVTPEARNLHANRVWVGVGEVWASIMPVAHEMVRIQDGPLKAVKINNVIDALVSWPPVASQTGADQVA